LGRLREDPGPVTEKELDEFESHVALYKQAIRAARSSKEGFQKSPSLTPRPWYEGFGSREDHTWWWETAFEDVWHAPRSYDDIKSASETGCEFCRQISIMLSQREADLVNTSFMLTLNRSNFDGRPEELYFKPAPYDANVSLIGAEISTCASTELSSTLGSDEALQQYPKLKPDNLFRLPTYSTKENECFDFLQSRLRDCLQSHPQCSTNNLDHWTPTRLVDVGDSGLGSGNVLVVETASWSTEQRLSMSGYITLSHTWGTDRFFTLLTSNLKDITTAGVDITLLRQSF
jgi:hypothetical protein